MRSLSLTCVPVPPTLLGSDEVKILTVPVNGHLTLECLADSDPAPEIEWYKDEVKVQVQRIRKCINCSLDRQTHLFLVTLSVFVLA